MASKKNSYQKKAQKKQVLEGVSVQKSKGGLKRTALETGRDILIGAVGGGLAGAAVGRSSFLVGIAVTGLGHYMGSGGATAFGVGMMASGGYHAMTGAMSGKPKEGLEGVKERVMAFKEEFKRKLYLDKIIKSTKKAEEKSTEGTNGMGDVQYFTYPNAKQMEGAGDHIQALDRIERQVAESAIAFEANQSVSGGMNGEAMGMLEVSEQNF